MDSDQTLSTRELAGAEPREESPTQREAADGAPANQDDGRRDHAGVRDDVAGVEATGEAQEPAATTDVGDESPELLPGEENAEFQRRWETIQTGFIDEPRQTVEQADELVAQVMKRLAEGFAAERERLEQQWGRGEDVSTEDLRIALQRYRGFFQRLLSA
jgi:hypothetical protein